MWCRAYSSQLCEYRGQCEAMLGEADKALHTLHAMRERHQFVAQRTGALHHACEQLMEDQVSSVYNVHMYIGCAVLLCFVYLFDLAYFFLSSFSSLIQNMYMYIYNLHVD